MRRSLLCVALAVGGIAACSSPPKIAPLLAVPKHEHVWLFVMENRAYSEIVGAPDAPYLNSLATKYGLASSYFATTQPSLPNYLVMIAGDTMGCSDDPECGGYRGVTIAGQLSDRGRQWAGFFEGMPSAGYTGPDTGGVGGYVRRHNPFTSFTEITGDPVMRASMRPFGEFAESLRDPPAFTLVVPSNAHNMHDGTVADGDAWLKQHLPAVMASKAFRKGGVIFVTWDEGEEADRAGCCLDGVDGGHVVTIVIDARGKHSFVSKTPHTHASLLATIEQTLDLPRLRRAREVTAMAEFWESGP